MASDRSAVGSDAVAAFPAVKSALYPFMGDGLSRRRRRACFKPRIAGQSEVIRSGGECRTTT